MNDELHKSDSQFMLTGMSSNKCCWASSLIAKAYAHYELRQGQEALFDVPILSSILFAKLIRYNFTAIKHIDSELVIFGFKNFKTWTCLVFCALLLYAAVAKIWMPILYIQLVGRSWSHMLRINLRKCGLNIILMWKSVINLHWSSTNTLEVSNTTNFSGQYL